ncbi:MAG TPA: putative quinol monooxygenase [Aestuariivirgaceae bacterium]|nr:putative quinol monooxygenase [Aestuariivirgaceae bacterium]
MLCVSVDFRLKPDAFEPFVMRVQQQARDSLQNEAGCTVFEVWTSADRPNEVHLHEVYDDAGAFDLHLESGHFQAFDTDVADMIIEKKVTLWDRKL